jgi:hypothetical protein
MATLRDTVARLKKRLLRLGRYRIRYILTGIIASIKVLLETDIGSDIDDAICLAYRLANPECKLLGITTVTGEADARASIASAV